MGITQKIIFIFIFQGVWCGDWNISLPDKIEALSGSCVIINCSFDINNAYNSDLTDTAAGAWYRNGTQDKVFHSKNTSIFKGNITGKLRDKDCTTIFYDVTSIHHGAFYFRLEGNGGLKFTFTQKSAPIHVLNSPPKPTVKMFKDQMEVQGEVLEGSSVNLRCSSQTLCSSSPPTLTWSSTDKLQLNGTSRLQENQTEIISDLNITATRLQHGVTFICTITYQLQSRNTTAQNNVTLFVQYAPQNTSVSVFPSGTILKGSSVTLTCSSDANPAVLNYTWYRENGAELQTGQNLTFNVTDRTQTGRYYCQARNQHGTQNTSVFLDIQYAPENTSVSVFPSDTILEGSLVTLTCSSDGNPVVLNYTWYRENGGQLQTGQNLTFNVTNRTHTGRYYCQARNQHGTQNSSVFLDIQYAPKNTSVSVFPSGTILEGSSVTLTCSSDGNPVVLNYTWYRENGAQLQTGQNLTFNVTNRTHTGRYYCQARNQYGTQNSSVFLDIQYAPKNTSVSVFPSDTILEGSSVTLTCSSDGNPVVLNYTWYRENGAQLQTGQNLTFNVTNRTHTGRYYCQARNRHGTQNSSVFLDIQYAPKNTSVSVFPSGTILEGSSVTLTCSSDGNPVVLNYTWYRENGGQLQTGQNLTFNVTNRTHTGRYYCQARNQYGTQNSSVFLDIQYAPKNTSVSVFPSDTILEGSSVTLTCSSDANPVVLNYTWYRENGAQLQTGQNLTFNVTNRTQTGRYYCQARNRHGIQNTSALLDIQYVPENTSVSVFPSDTILEGSSVTLTCSSDANPIVLNYTWYRENGAELQTGQNLTFNVTDHTQTGRYYCLARNQHGTQNTSVMLNIQYAPQISSCSSHTLGNVMMFSCEAHGNPPPIVEWHLSGNPVTNSTNTFISEERLNSAVLRSVITLHQSLIHTDNLQCVCTNNYGTARIQFQNTVLPSYQQTSWFSLYSLLAGLAVGALVMVMLYVTTLMCNKFLSQTRQDDKTGLVLNDGAVLQEKEECVYANKVMQSPFGDTTLDYPESLHYSTIDFTRTKTESGEIKGVSSLTTDYAVIRYYRETTPKAGADVKQIDLKNDKLALLTVSDKTVYAEINHQNN